MNVPNYIPESLYDDEVVAFLASRYHTTSRAVWECFLRQERGNEETEEAASPFSLESNEMEILRGLIRMNYPG